MRKIKATFEFEVTDDCDADGAKQLVKELFDLRALAVWHAIGKWELSDGFRVIARSGDSSRAYAP
jgi:hypothetical protein